MKSLVIVAILLSGFYMFSVNLLMNQLNNLEDFYGNIDTYASQALDPSQKTAIRPQPLVSNTQPIKFGN
jgi:hypothetical protein